MKLVRTATLIFALMRLSRGTAEDNSPGLPEDERLVLENDSLNEETKNAEDKRLALENDSLNEEMQDLRNEHLVLENDLFNEERKDSENEQRLALGNDSLNEESNHFDESQRGNLRQGGIAWTASGTNWSTAWKFHRGHSSVCNRCNGTSMCHARLNHAKNSFTTYIQNKNKKKYSCWIYSYRPLANPAIMYKRCWGCWNGCKCSCWCKVRCEYKLRCL